MALSDLKKFSEYHYLATGEMYADKIELFNAASAGTIVLKGGFSQGDFESKISFGLMSNFIERRDMTSNAAIGSATPTQVENATVKVATRTKELLFNPGDFQWIKQNPEDAARDLAARTAQFMLFDQLNNAIAASYAAINQNADTLLDISGAATAAAKTITWRQLNLGADKFGDASGDIACWLMHSHLLTGLYDQNLANAQNLFQWGGVVVKRDFAGRLIVITDNANLKSGTVYRALGLTSEAVVVQQNNDYLANEETRNGTEQITHSFQAQWTYNLGIKGFTWDKTNGSYAPSNAALATATNWDRIQGLKNSAGVVVKGYATEAEAA